MHGIDFLFKSLTHKLMPEFETHPTTPNDVCDCCGRSSAKWADPTKKTVGSYSGQTETHCVACQGLYHGSFELIGREGFRGENPVAMKLGMLKGCGLLLQENSAIIYAPGKYFQKFIDAKNSIFDTVIDLGGKHIIIDALSRKPKPPFLFIQNFGVKKGDLVSHLKVSDSADYISICTDADCTELPMTFLTFQQAIAGMPKKEATAWLELFKRSSNHYLSIDDVNTLNTLTQLHPELASAARQLPADPHLRIKCALLAGEAVQ